MGKHLSDAQIEQYRRDGYVAPMRAYEAEEIAALTARLEAFEAEHGVEAQQKLVFKAHLPYKWLNEVIRHPKILDAVEDVIGPNLLCWGTGFFQKNAHDPRFVSWHQDTFYYGLDPAETCTAWLAFTRSDLDSGCVRVIPGSHRENPNLEFANEPDEHNLLIRGQTIEGLDLGRARPMVLDAGEFSMHHESIVHGSDPNQSNHRRIGLSIHYISPDVRRAEYNTSTKPGATLVRGVDQYGHWAHEAAPEEEFDAEAFAFLNKMRAEFFQRGRDGVMVDKPART